MTTLDMRATKNVELEVQRFAEFSRDVLGPVFADILLATSKYLPQTQVTQRHIRDSYGLSTARAFDLMFQKLAKGNQDRSGKPYKSSWLPNLKAINYYAEWIKSTDEKTGRSLYHFLVEKGCQPVEWNNALKCWITADLAQQLRDAKARTEQEEADLGVDYGALLASIKGVPPSVRESAAIQ